jgi:hypothetical protein
VGGFHPALTISADAAKPCDDAKIAAILGYDLFDNENRDKKTKPAAARASPPVNFVANRRLSGG